MVQSGSDYVYWIQKNIRIKYRVYDNVRYIVYTMRKQFPELRVASGYYICTRWKTTIPHLWLKTKDGKIIDPCNHKFPSMGKGLYKEA